MKRVYFDYNATSPMAPAVRRAMGPFLNGAFGNPSSLHQAGQRARYAIETAREKFATILEARPEEIIFTSGGTEANNLALKGVMRARRAEGRDHLIISAVEHPSVRDTAWFLEKEGLTRVTVLGVDATGAVRPRDLEDALDERTALVSVMHANNETGRIQPVEALAPRAHAAGAWLHVDACQSLGKISVTIGALGCDLASFSGHKIYGPKGSGALYVRGRAALEAVWHGGHQERNVRPGTENTAAIAGLAEAASFAEKTRARDVRRLAAARERIWRLLQKDPGGVVLNGSLKESLANTLNVSFEGVDGPGLAMSLDLAGVAVSTGAACTSGSTEPSPVLLAMGLDERRARGAVRISMGHFTTGGDVERLVRALSAAVKRLRRKSA